MFVFSDLEGQGQAGDTAELAAGVLAVHGLLLVGGVVDRGAHLLRALREVPLVEVGVLHERGGPGVAVEGLAGDHHGGGGDGGGQEAQHTVFLEGALGEVARQLHHSAISVGSFEVAAQERVHGGHGELVLESVHDLRLHLEDLLLVVGAVGDVHQVTDLRRVNFLILSGNL